MEPKSLKVRSGPAKAAGKLPEWNLADLYSGVDAPEVKRDLDRADSYSQAFEEAFKGKLSELAKRQDAGAQFAEAISRFEMIDDLMGRLMSYAGLLYAGNTADPTRAKFYGDVQERITTASSNLLFFTLELNRLEDGALDAAMADPALGHYRPWIEDVRKEKPYQLEDRVEELFHEKSVTGAGAWNRLFNETIGTLRFRVAGKELAIEATLTLMQDADGNKRQAASEAL
ncbi:MAG: M3 family oligoendopeptidase, partial [Xanthobacteraceae bacterium]